MTLQALEDRIARSLCREKCAFMGEPPCFATGAWPNANCDEPGCMAEAAAVVSDAATLRALIAGETP